MTKRTIRLNSLLQEVISEVIRKDVRHPRLGKLVSVTGVEITADLHFAKVHVSVIGTEQEKTESIEALNSAAGFISVNASKKVVMRYFPELTFHLDTSADKFSRIDTVLGQIHREQQSRQDADNNKDQN